MNRDNFFLLNCNDNKLHVSFESDFLFSESLILDRQQDLDSQKKKKNFLLILIETKHFVFVAQFGRIQEDSSAASGILNVVRVFEGFHVDVDVDVSHYLLTQIEKK
jgi:hypothetical protein